MDWLPFFGSDDDEDVERVSSGDSDMTVVTNYDNVNVVGAESSSTRSEGSLRVHTISLGDDGGTSSTGTGGGSRRTAPAPSSPDDDPATPSSPTVDPEPTSDPYSRGTFVLPEDKHFLQKLEARGKNGHQSIVETVYVLTGASYTQPTDLIRLDNEAYYSSATKTSVRFKPKKMARKVASLYPDGESPKLIARFHTHPGGTLRPSSADKSSAKSVRKSFESAFGTDDFEFFHGIHGLAEHGKNPGPAKRQHPETSSGHVRWLGERYRHKLAVYGEGFQTQKDIATN